MPVTYTYTAKLPYHSTHKINDTFIDICLGKDDTVALPDDTKLLDRRLNNMINTQVLVPVKKQETTKEKKPEPQKATNNITSIKNAL